MLLSNVDFIFNEEILNIYIIHFFLNFISYICALGTYRALINTLKHIKKASK
jgi:hypothetical protein